MEDYPYPETFMEFAASFLALFTGITSACAVTHSRVNIPFVNAEVWLDGLFLPVSVIGRFLDLSAHVGRLKHSQE